MSYNNYLDVDSAWNCVSDSENPRCAVMKHTNPGEVYWLAVIADPGSTFGSIEAANVKADKCIKSINWLELLMIDEHVSTTIYSLIQFQFISLIKLNTCYTNSGILRNKKKRHLLCC
ncbi:hypothetical protein YC2023_118904 [Brassica napus]